MHVGAYRLYLEIITLYAKLIIFSPYCHAPNVICIWEVFFFRIWELLFSVWIFFFWHLRRGLYSHVRSGMYYVVIFCCSCVYYTMARQKVHSSYINERLYYLVNQVLEVFITSFMALMAVWWHIIAVLPRGIIHSWPMNAVYVYIFHTLGSLL